MPRKVDPEARRQQILRATTEIIAERGLRALSFRLVAERMGGSTTLVTHYYPTQKELLDDLAHRSTESFLAGPPDGDLGSADARTRLRGVMAWLLPTTETGLVDERARINLLADQLLGAEHREIFAEWDVKMRGLLREEIAAIVPSSEVETMVDLMRVVANGLTLSAIEHPDEWPGERQLAVVDHLLDQLRI